MTPHPYERFEAPDAIGKGSNLAGLLDPVAVDLLAESIAAVNTDFDARGFVRTASRDLDDKSLMQRAEHIGDALVGHLPSAAREALGIINASLGPPLAVCEGYGLKPFFYLPHGAAIARFAERSPVAGLEACKRLTQRFSAEFCIRPYLIAEPDRTLATLQSWTAHASPHVRRLCSEGTRPRLPWGVRLQAFVEDPRPVLPLLEALKDDPERYVTRSVANHLGDIGKDHYGLHLQICERWLGECEGLSAAQAKERRWLIRHALRYHAKRGDAKARALRTAAA